MPKNLRWKWLLIMAIIVVSILAVTGVPTSLQQLRENLGRNVRLGLDLRGGSHLVLQVQVQDAFKLEADQFIERLQSQLQKQGITPQSIDRNDPNSIETAETITVEVRGVPADREADFSRTVSGLSGDTWMLQRAGTDGHRLQIRKSAALAIRQDTLAKTIETLDRKVNALGVAEASVQQRGGVDGAAEVLVQLPGVDDPVRVRSILQTAAMLELSEVKGGPFSSREEALVANGGVLPLNTKLVQASARAGDGSWYLLGRSPVVTGRDLRDSRSQAGDGGFGWETSFVLTQDAAEKFRRFTGANVGNRLAIVLDNVVLSAPRIDSAIGDQGRITGASSQDEAADLALNLRAGALPAGIKVIEERIVGPSLGADSIRRGVSAGLVGLALVIASMILYYRGAGLNAVVALLLNSLITVAALSYIDATWTLPGIAGLVLSIGMAVDSNVLIFERIKEELRNGGKGVPAAINAGFQRAFVTILDTHVTTVVASLFLFLFGTGPVRGFAVTLVIGLIANLFTAVFVSRAIFDWQMFRSPRLHSLSIWPKKGGELFNTPNFAFMNKRAITLGISALAVVASIALLATKGVEYGLDFRGGTLTYVRFDPVPPIDELRQAVSAEIDGEISVQEVRGAGGEFIVGSELADEQELERKRRGIRQALERRYGQPGPARIDLNNSSVGALAEALQAGAVSRNLPLSSEQWNDLAVRLNGYRDREGRGIVKSFEDLRRVEGITPEMLEVVKAQTYLSPFNIRSVEMVGPRAGEQLRRSALMATIGAFVGMLAYIAWRFRLVAGLAAVIATTHDVLITVGLFALTGREVNLNVIAALLTLIGYSMNDKIVVFDRVRENQQAKRGTGDFSDLVNDSINQTLSRTLLTAGPTLLACLALYFLGGEVLNGIAFALIAGILVGTYSSISVASALLVFWHERGVRKRAQLKGAVAATNPTVALRKR
jgi:preprotein translocase subunit SecD